VIPLTDTHCHLDFTLFNNDRETAVSRARDAGVIRILNPGIDVESSRAAVEIAETTPEVFAACGVHPNDALTWKADTLDELRKLAGHEKIVAIGEIGLDYYRDRTPEDVQKLVFRSQLTLAAELGLPVIIHNRQASEDIMDMLAVWHQELIASGSPLVQSPGVLHSFSADIITARRALELNFFIGITGPITFRNADDLRQIIRSIPLSSLLIETDSPFLTPHPHRGERNEPAFVRWVAEKISEVHNLPIQVVAEKTTSNSNLLFGW